ncbi:MAG: hypothetical protein U5J83_02405 [Bryobacterales bacterium]|nr:hypothetical protein [Bryobacterales bacterium]
MNPSTGLPHAADSGLSAFQWETQPDAEAWLRFVVEGFLEQAPFAQSLAGRMERETATRFFDWIDHIRLPRASVDLGMLSNLGFVQDSRVRTACYIHPGAIFPRVVFSSDDAIAVALKVDSVADFLQAQRVHASIEGAVFNPVRRARIENTGRAELWAMERRGWVGFDVADAEEGRRMAAQRHLDAFRTRRRRFENPHDGFVLAEALIGKAINEIGQDWTCALFFETEREYWQRRCKAGAVQKIRQDRLGLGWANHDHHTYRSSRECFVPLIRVLEKLGFRCRERFRPGREAGWGAQVIEQPNTGVTIFADVDMSPEELLGDFAHIPMPPREQLGTVGLWCALHGEAFLEAGMHHLECQFDFSRLTAQLAEEGVGMMMPFSSFPYLKQAFSEGDVWPVAERRIAALFESGKIGAEEAERFRREGALGAHLENLERNEGFKGFNQTGINEIIAGTDPRFGARRGSGGHV